MTKVYLVEVRGNDYYDRLEFFGVYADREAAVARAEELWKIGRASCRERV